MKLPIICLALFVLLNAACNDTPKASAGAHAVPESLQDENSSSRIVYKRSHADLLEQLYGELVSGDTALSSLEKQIVAIREMKSDSLLAFHTFDRKNTAYYDAAKSLIERMPDSALRKFADSILSVSKVKYRSVVTAHEQRQDEIEEQTRQLQSIHSLLKLVNTLPAIERFSNQLPPISSLDAYKNQLRLVTEKTAALTDKKLEEK